MALCGLDSPLRRKFKLWAAMIGRRCAAGTSRRVLVGIGVVGVVAAVASLAGCGEAVSKVKLDTPALAPLSIPPLLEPTIENGVSHYDLTIGTSQHDYKQARMTDTYSYNGLSVLGPTLRLKSGASVAISVHNDLDEVTTTHWHGGDVPAEDDGGPHSPIEPGTTWVADFEVIQPAATLWYHPHRHGATAEHVYLGGAGLIIIDDDNPTGTLLPATYGIDDIPVIIQDRAFTADGQLDFAINDGDDGKLDDILTVNGTLDPYVETPTGLVRLRLLNGSQARIYRLSVDSADMIKIASDGGYLSNPVAIDELAIAPGDRAEIIVNVGAEFVALVDSELGRVLELRPDASVSGAGTLPDTLATIDRISESEIAVDRVFHMEDARNWWDFSPKWAFNGVQFDMNRIDETVQFGDTERWTLTVGDGQHVFHVHQTMFQILAINGEPPPPEEAGWEDSVWVNADREVVIAARFDTYATEDIPYLFHCHILDHEDLEMMGQYQIVD